MTRAHTTVLRIENAYKSSLSTLLAGRITPAKADLHPCGTTRLSTPKAGERTLMSTAKSPKATSSKLIATTCLLQLIPDTDGG